MRSVSAMPYSLVAHSFCNPLPSGFRAKISNQVKTMEQLKRGMTVGDKTAFDLEAIFLRLLMGGQKRQLQLAPNMSCATYLPRSLMLTEVEQIYPSQSFRIKTSLCSRSRHLHSGYATGALSHCLATRRRRL